MTWWYWLLHVQEVIDEGDEKFEDLKTEFGDEVVEAVTTALAELN